MLENGFKEGGTRSSIPTRVRNLFTSRVEVWAWTVPAYLQGFETCPCMVMSMPKRKSSSIPTRVRNTGWQQATNSDDLRSSIPTRVRNLVMSLRLLCLERCSSIPTRVRNPFHPSAYHVFDAVPAYLQGFETSESTANSCPTWIVPAYLQGFETNPPHQLIAPIPMFQHTYKGSKRGISIPSITNIISSSIPTRVRNYEP